MEFGNARVIGWAELAADHPVPLIDRKRIFGEKMMVAEVVLHKGFSVPTHHHPNEQISLVMSGRVRFGIGAEGSAERREVEVVAGQVVVLPGNTPHSAVALEESLLLDLFSPPAERMGVDAVRDGHG